MQVQSFLLDEVPAVLPSGDELTDELLERRALLDELGFTNLAHWESEGEVKFFTAKMLFPELTGRNMRLWRQFLPTHHASASSYTFDNVPQEALEHIRTATRLGCFERIEIWTPEGNSFLGLAARKLHVAKEKLAEFGERIDPMAVGVARDINGNERLFQIVRWGESSLQAIEAIRRHVRMVNWKATALLVILPFVVMTLLVSAYVNGIQQWGYGDMFSFTLLAAALLIIAVGGSLAIHDHRRR